ncbi:MAG: POTRA domain-containing protein [Chthoniobacteraceae bacterium]
MPVLFQPASRFTPPFVGAMLIAAGWLGSALARGAEDTMSAPTAENSQRLNIREYRVSGARLLNATEVGEVVYPFLGPERTNDDVEQARAALEKAYRDKGFQTVSVEIPQQKVRRGVVILNVVENKVGRLRVKGARYFSLDDIKRLAPSVAEGTVPNFNDITRDILALNQLPDRRVTPTLRPGAAPGTVDIDLNVKDTLPVHGSVEVNNRYSADTTELRVNGSASYNNLWQRGHALGVSFQVAPQRPDDAKIFSAYYLARFPQLSWLSLLVQGTKQDSNVSTLGGTAVAGRGEVLGARAMLTLPSRPGFFHTLSVGMDYKHFLEDVQIGATTTQTPITYYPLSASYNASWVGKGRLTELNTALNFHLRGTGSAQNEFDAKRYGADGSFIYLRGDLSHTQDLPGGFQIFGKVQGQLSPDPLLNSEQFSGGGLGTARGYLESSALGDSAVFGTLELRSPSLLGWWKNVGELRVYGFLDAGELTLNDPLPEQTSRFELASWGVGGRLRLLDHLGGSIDAGIPLITQGQSLADNLLLTFRMWADF